MNVNEEHVTYEITAPSSMPGAIGTILITSRGDYFHGSARFARFARRMVGELATISGSNIPPELLRSVGIDTCAGDERRTKLLREHRRMSAAR